MKNLLVLLSLLLFLTNLYSQEISERKIIGVSNSQFSAYDIMYDKNSGTYIQSVYDTIINKSKILSNKGNSGSYDYLSFYNSIFDDEGNYYLTATKYNDSYGIEKAFFIKNGVVLKEYQNIGYSFLKKDNNIYFIANDNGKDVRVIYSINNGVFKYSNPYDTITLAYVNKNDEKPYEGEYNFDIGFTKDGKDFFIASSNGKQMIVLNNQEMKAYDRIESGEIILDKNGNPTYIAKEIVNGKNYYITVQGEKEYDKQAYATMPMIFDESNNVYYIATDVDNDFGANARVMKGNEVYSRTFNNGIYDLGVTPDGKVYYVGTDTTNEGKFVSTLFIDNKEIASYANLWGIKFKKSGTPVYVATDTDYNYFVVEGNKKMSDKYSTVINLKVKNNDDVSFIGMNYSDNPEERPEAYYIDGQKKIGPVYNLPIGEYVPDYFVSNDKNAFAYITTDIGKSGKDEYTRMYVIGDGWKSPKHDYISDIYSYKNDFYYIGTSFKDIYSENRIYKNGDKLGKKYDSINEFKLDKDKGILSFIGVRDNTAYYCKINL